MSESRDLVFRVPEQAFTLPGIRRMFDKLELSFLGFELAHEAQYVACHERFLTDPQAQSLDFLREFETHYPNTFASMYQFWPQRR